MRYCQQQMELGRRITILTSLLSTDALQTLLRLIKGLSAQHAELEIICNDWGLIHAVHSRFDCTLIAGRLLAMQRSDPRFALFNRTERQRRLERSVPHLDGADVRLEYKPPSPELLRHLRQSPLDAPGTLDLLRTRGINRLEVSNLLQGIEMASSPGWRVSLHLPEVIIAVSRKCPQMRKRCSSAVAPACATRVEQVARKDFPVPLYHAQNAWFYDNPDMPVDLPGLGIDRIVRRMHKEPASP